MHKSKQKRTRNKPRASRRDFMKKAVLGAGATAALSGAKVGLAAPAEDGGKPITIPKEFAQAEALTLKPIDFPMVGAQVFARACKEDKGVIPIALGGEGLVPVEWEIRFR